MSVTDTQKPCCVVIPTLPKVPQTIINNPILKTDPKQIVISSSKSEVNLTDKNSVTGDFKGDVNIVRGDDRVHANQVSVIANILQASGNLFFQTVTFTIIADSLVANLNTNAAALKNSTYWLNGRQVNGTAQELIILPNKGVILHKAIISTCPADNRSWELDAREIKINSTDDWADVWGATFKIGDIPVMYIPYLNLPVSNKRKSGLLYPSFSNNSSSGFIYSQPIYWNIAPNYDLTFTPTTMTKRGLLLNGELRYLTQDGDNKQTGQFNIEYLNKDAEDDDQKRNLFHWEHKGALSDNIRVAANVTTISDDNFFNDIGSNVSQPTDSEISRFGQITYFHKNWDLGLKVQDILVLSDDKSPYKVLPRLNFNYVKNDLPNNLNFKLYSEITNFKSKYLVNNSATRIHFAPSLIYPIYMPSSSLISEIKLLQTNYIQSDLNPVNNPQNTLSQNINRTIPEIKINGKVNFERETNWFGEKLKQTLEPQIQYLYVGYKNQSNIGLYDTSTLQEDYVGIFRDNRYSGLDRIADANQITLGISSGFYDISNREQLKFSIGQIIYLQSSKVSLIPNEVDNNRSSLFVAEVNAKLPDNWYINTGVQYNANLGEVGKTGATLDYRPTSNKLLQFNYHYIPNLLNILTNETSNISQTGILAAWPLSNSVSVVGSWNYDLNKQQSMENYAGVQYESCCWAVRFLYKRNITNYYGPSNTGSYTTFESGFYLNFEIKGLGSNDSEVSKMLNEGIFNYRMPIYLTN